jgi:hypothetical protein
MDLVEIGLNVVDWIDLAQDRDDWKALVNAVMNFVGSIKCWGTTEWLHNCGLSSGTQLHRVSC